MAIDITGIINENEFYTNHYLHSILEDDLKEVFVKWRDDSELNKTKTPDQLLRALPQVFFKVKADLEKLRGEEKVLKRQRPFTNELLKALGYELTPSMMLTESNAQLPIVGEITDSQGNPNLWILETVSSISNPEDPLEQVIHSEQYPDDDTLQHLEGTWVEIITREIFGLTSPPRWIILFDFSSIILIDRSKWNEKRLLRFDLNEIFGRRESSTFRAMAALLHRDSICPGEGQALLDTLDEQSHRHAFAVSEDLKYSLREAIELIGNEAIYYRREVLKQAVYNKDLSDELTIESLRYMYRLLFLLYLEARPELGFAEMQNPVFRQGYSLESLRDLEIVPLTTEESRNGFYIHNSISMLFNLVYDGYDPNNQAKLSLDKGVGHDNFSLPPLKSHLFDPERTPLLNKVKFRNSVLQRVLELMSLSRPTRGRNKRRGRISYAQLGINQLGAVYEGLLSYRGFFAETDLYEVKRADQDTVNELEQAYFVTEDDLPKYKEDEKVFNSSADQERNPQWRQGTLRKYPKGTFIYRLAGRDREKSASYYTPEVLTQCLVEYALKELLKDKTADDILKLKICEPAMGSAAFLNEAINQLADTYMRLKQEELNEILPPDKYNFERQKVKMLLADQNVFGVDLNPIAVELAEVSLWLNSIHAGGFVPWFGMQLTTGNSLIGARRQMFSSTLLGKKEKGDKSWLDEVPKRYWPKSAGLNPPESEISDRRKKVYHFLLPDTGMANYKDKVVRSLAPTQIEAINKWRKAFTNPFRPNEIKLLEQLSESIDRLWAKHIKQLRKLRDETTDPLEVYGQPSSTHEASSTRLKDRRLAQELLSENIQNSSLYRRLKMAMDYWCALWFWPIESAHLLPTRIEYLSDIQLIIEGQEVELRPEVNEQIPLFPSTAPKQEMLALRDEFGFVDVEKLTSEVSRLGLVRDLVGKYHFLHWELDYADLYANNGGFDLILGNPPWLKVEWNEKGILSEEEPSLIIQKLSAARVNERRSDLLMSLSLKTEYLTSYEGAAGTQLFLNAKQNYPSLEALQTNLYKCFLPQGWSLLSNFSGACGYLHPEGIYDDPKGGNLRAAVYERLRYHFQFQNGLMLFPDVAHREKFSINIYSGKVEVDQIKFITIANLFAVKTVEESFNSNSSSSVQGIKNEKNKWNTGGHPERIVTITPTELEHFANLYDPRGTPFNNARLPVVHSLQIRDVLAAYSKSTLQMSNVIRDYYWTEMWHETNAQKNGYIVRRTRFPDSFNDLILSGPHIYLGNPLYKTPRKKCTEKSHYDVVDLQSIDLNYIPRTNYLPDTSGNNIERKLSSLPWDGDISTTDTYRIVFRSMLPPPNERTFASSILPPGSGHINTASTITFERIIDLIAASSTWLSLPVDFLVKTTGKPKADPSLLEVLPVVHSPLLRLRSLLLCSLTASFAELWELGFDPGFREDRFTKIDSRLENSRFVKLGPELDINTALRSDFARRQALIEIDVLVARALGLNLEELCVMYRTMFPVLVQNENDTWYDQNGRIVFTVSKGLPGVGLTRHEWNEAKEMTSGSIEKTVVEDIMPDYRKAHARIRLDDGTILDCPCPDYPEPIPGPVNRLITYKPPFDRCDREADYRTAWEAFKKRGI